MKSGLDWHIPESPGVIGQIAVVDCRKRRRLAVPGCNIASDLSIRSDIKDVGPLIYGGIKGYDGSGYGEFFCEKKFIVEALKTVSDEKSPGVWSHTLRLSGKVVALICLTDVRAQLDESWKEKKRTHPAMKFGNSGHYVLDSAGNVYELTIKKDRVFFEDLDGFG